MNNKNPTISVILLENCDPNIKKFSKCIESYINQDYENYEIILIIWGKGKNNIYNVFREKNIPLNKISIFRYKGDPGYAKGNNLGVKKAKGQFIIISNPDVEVNSNFLNDLIGTYNNLKKKKLTDKLIIGPRICNKEGVIEYSQRWINYLGFGKMDISKSTKIKRTMVSSGCNFFIKKKCYLKLDGLDEKYFMYKEDVDFSIRAYSMDFLQYINNSIHLYHLKSDEEYKLNSFKYYYHERNRIIMTLEHSKKKKKMLLIHIIFEAIHWIFALKKGFIKERLQIYKYIFQNIFNLLKPSGKENEIFDRFYDMKGIFNEVPLNSFNFKLINFFSRILFYFYHL